jgi:hypothetical protein
MKWKPKVIYNGVTLLFLISQRPWSPKSKGVGGYGISGAGVPESYKQRRDQRLTLILRFYESQLNAVMLWLEYCQDNAGTPFDFYLETTDGTPVSVYLDEPTIVEEIIPVRSQQFPKMYEQTVTIRSVDGSRFTRAYL